MASLGALGCSVVADTHSPPRARKRDEDRSPADATPAAALRPSPAPATGAGRVSGGGSGPAPAASADPREAGFSWPLRGPITSPFGPSRTRSHHAGIDIAAEAREEIHAAAAGRVTKVADDPMYGLMVVISHGRGYATLYAHTSALLVGKGDEVARGQVIALVGETGDATGTHLHFEIRRNGRPVNPLPFLK